MRVDFYQLSGQRVETVAPQLASKVYESGERLLLVAGDEALRRRIDEALWTFDPAAFLPHGAADEAGDERQPILLADNSDAAGSDRLTMLADGIWRDEALRSERAFYLFEGNRIDEARAAWRAIGERDGADRHFWKHESGSWREGP